MSELNQCLLIIFSVLQDVLPRKSRKQLSTVQGETEAQAAVELLGGLGMQWEGWAGGMALEGPKEMGQGGRGRIRDRNLAGEPCSLPQKHLLSIRRCVHKNSTLFLLPYSKIEKKPKLVTVRQD